MGRQTDWWWPEEGWRRPDNEWAAEFVVRQTGPLGASHQQSLKVSQSLLLLIARRNFSPKKDPGHGTGPGGMTDLAVSIRL
ncbi:hypothetical protein ColKHC_06876 [Colletotrichum higginsianum]|nr:hypothetical protein ColKHC_06876 [Colletotrichum higginsianum]